MAITTSKYDAQDAEKVSIAMSEQLVKQHQIRISAQQQRQSSVKAARSTLTVPILICIPSILLLFGAVLMFAERFSSNEVFVRLFPALEQYEADISTIFQNQIIREIQNDINQQLIESQVALANQNSSVRYLLQLQQSEVQVQNVAEDDSEIELSSDRLEEITLLLEEAEENLAQLQVETEARELSQAELELANEQQRLEFESLLSSQQSDYDYLLQSQERQAFLLEQYGTAITTLQNGIVERNISGVRGGVRQLNNYALRLANANDPVAQFIIYSSNQLINAGEAYISLLDASSGSNAEAATATSELQQQVQAFEERTAALNNQITDLQATITRVRDDLSNAVRRQDICNSDLIRLRQSCSL